jgi:phosphoglycolate phosphatase-like HAD superfamily hydrolase
MKLAIFDNDGTLVDTDQADEDCFARALELEFGTTGASMNWADYTHVTDSGITREIFQQVFGRYPEPEEIRRLTDRFVDLLKSYSQRFNEIPGARDLLRLLSDTSDWKIAIATGGWYAPATYKLKCANISIEDIPLSTADDVISREDIVRDCIAKAQTHYGVNRFSKIVSVGDGVWDVKTAKKLGLPFIGVGDEARLRGWDAFHVVQDYRDPMGFIQLLEEAQIPKH